MKQVQSLPPVSKITLIKNIFRIKSEFMILHGILGLMWFNDTMHYSGFNVV